MIRCIQIGTTTVQGTYLTSVQNPVRRPPSYELQWVEQGTVMAEDRAVTGDMTPTYRRRCGECREIHGKHLDWCPERD